MGREFSTGGVRLLIGLLQGLALYGLVQCVKEKYWPVTWPEAFVALSLLVVLVPWPAITAFRHLSMRALIQWLVVVAVLVGSLGWYDGWRMGARGDVFQIPSITACLLLSVGLFMAHALVLSASQDGRRVASYVTYFDQAWKLFVQHLFSWAFLGVLWAMLYLGAALFSLIHLSFLSELLRKSWFYVPVSTVAVAWALHITDVKPEIAQGIRGLILVLLSWILPVIVLLATGFLVSLPFTGLTPLWETRSATAVLLSTMAALVVLINAAFQNGQHSQIINPVVRLAASLSSLLLLPLAVLAIYALSLRVNQYGWTSDRIIATACLLVASIYALGYAWAVISRDGAWLGPIAQVNVWVAWLILLIFLALLSPLADPARISVNDQMTRLRDGRVSAKTFDSTYFRFDAGRYGYEQLKALADGKIAHPQHQALMALAKGALAQTSRCDGQVTAAPFDLQSSKANISAVWPKGAQLPESFFQVNWLEDKRRYMGLLPTCLTEANAPCEAYVLSLDDDASPEILLMQKNTGAPTVFALNAQHQWAVVGVLPWKWRDCEAMKQRLRDGHFEYVSPRFKALKMGDVQITIEMNESTIGMDSSVKALACQ